MHSFQKLKQQDNEKYIQDTILFNRQKIKADGKTAILCRITIDGKSTAITTGEECKSSEWNSRKGLTTDKKTNQRIGEF